MQDSKGDLGQANTLCTQYVTRKVDAVVVNIYVASQMGLCMSQAKSAHIPVFYIAADFSKGMAGAISTNVPTPINQLFVKQQKARGKVDALALDYTPGSPCRTRKVELAKMLKSAPGISVTHHEMKVPGQVADNQAATQAWLAGHPASLHQKLAIWGCYSDAAVGALSALRQVGRKGVPIYTWDFTKPILPAIRAGQVVADLWVNPEAMATQLIGMIKKYEASGKVQGQLQAPYKVITPKNVNAFLKTHPGEPKG